MGLKFLRLELTEDLEPWNEKCTDVKSLLRIVCVDPANPQEQPAVTLSIIFERGMTVEQLGDKLERLGCKLRMGYTGYQE